MMRKGIVAVAPRVDEVEREHDLKQHIEHAGILIVEDSATMRSAIVSLLRSAGYQNIVQAKDGAQGLQVAKKDRPELIVSDLVMPNMDGFEFCRLVRSDPELRTVPILVETSMANLNDRAAAFDAGATDLIGKPLNPREFLGRVRVHLERARLLQHLYEFRRLMNLELEQARETQELLLPTASSLRQIEARYPLLLTSHYETSIGIGGDFWGVRGIDDHQCNVFSVDFSGHGVGAALNTARLHSFISREQALMGDPAAWLAEINRFLCETLPVGQYATMFSAVIDFSKNLLRYAAASAPAPIVFSAGDGAHFRLIDGSGFPLGVAFESTFDNRAIPFGPGSMLFLYSDALIETPDLASPMFSSEDLCVFLEERAQKMTPAQLQAALLAALNTKTRPSDDLTMVTVMHEVH